MSTDRIDAAVEATVRLAATAPGDPVLMAALTGPATLAQEVIGPEVEMLTHSRHPHSAAAVVLRELDRQREPAPKMLPKTAAATSSLIASGSR